LLDQKKLGFWVWFWAWVWVQNPEPKCLSLAPNRVHITQVPVSRGRAGRGLRGGGDHQDHAPDPGHPDGGVQGRGERARGSARLADGAGRGHAAPQSARPRRAATLPGGQRVRAAARATRVLRGGGGGGRGCEWPLALAGLRSGQ
jgi:hypothetical protein